MAIILTANTQPKWPKYKEDLETAKTTYKKQKIPTEQQKIQHNPELCCHSLDSTLKMSDLKLFKMCHVLYCFWLTTADQQSSVTAIKNTLSMRAMQHKQSQLIMFFKNLHGLSDLEMPTCIAPAYMYWICSATSTSRFYLFHISIYFGIDCRLTLDDLET